MIIKSARQLRQLLDRIGKRRERIILTHRGKDAAVLLPIEDLARLEELEDECDVEAARNSELEAKMSGEAPLAWGELKRTLGL
jgi:prevent-host-death family protein